MESKKNSSSSLTAELFGFKESPPKSSTGIFASIFPPPSQVVGRNSSRSELNEYWHKQSLGNQAWNTKQGNQAKSSEGAYNSLPNKDCSSVLQEERAEPCHLSSSLYYGGQEVYSQSPPIMPLDPILYSRKMGEKMIQMEAMRTVLPEEIGGKVRSIIRALPSLAMNSSSIFQEFMRPWFLSMVNM